MEMLAVWMVALQQEQLLSPRDSKLLIVFVGLVALAMVVQALALAVFASIAGKSIKSLMATVEELKGKALPLIHSAQELTASAKEITSKAKLVIDDAAPKVRTITNNLAESSEVVRNSAHQLNQTVMDANDRTKRQVARVDGMVTAALTTTAEIVETITHGIRVPAQKIAVLATQTWMMVEGLAAKGRSLAATLPFSQDRPTR